MIIKIFFYLSLIFSLFACKTVDVHKAMDMTFTTLQATEKVLRPISDEEEYFIGKAVAARLLQYYSLYDNQRLIKYINLIGQTIALHSEKPLTFGGYHFAILNTEELNAFACPGGIILITRGMIELAQTEDEIASILAHEIAHINHRDGINSIKQARWTEALTIIGKKAVSQFGSEELVKLTNIFEGTVEDVVKTLILNGYSKTQEFSADEKALLYLKKAGYNPYALISVLERMKKYSFKEGIFKTHPKAEDRINNLKEKVPTSDVDRNFLKVRFNRFRDFTRKY